MKRASRNVRSGKNKIQLCCSSIEQLETRRMMYTTSSAWGVTNLSYSYSNFLDNAAGWAVGLARVDMQNAVEEAMGVWTAVTPLRIFSRIDSGPPASDTNYPVETHPTFRWGHHFIDGPSIPGFSNVLGHGNPPGTSGLAGDMHFDDSNTFTIDGVLELGAHEFGHAIGMGHPNGEVVNGVEPPPFPAIMHAVIGGGVPVPGGPPSWDYDGLESGYLLQDDINGIRSLYGSGLGYVIDGFGELNVYGTQGNDLLSVDVSGGNITVTSAVVGGAFTGSFTRALNDGQTTINSIQLHGLSGNDILRVENSGGRRANFYGGAGDDTFELGVVSKNLDSIGEAQFFGGVGVDRIGIYDNNNVAGHTYTVTSSRVDRPGWAGLSYDFSTEGLSLTTGNTANTVNVLSTYAGQPVTLNSGGGTDIVNIGNVSNGVQSISANIEINNSPNFSTVNINNAPDAGAHSVTSGTNGAYGYIAGLAPGTISFKYADVSAINVALGTGVDNMSIYHTVKPVTVTNAGGAGTVSVGGTNGLQSIVGSLTINGVAGASQVLTLNDVANTTARTSTLTVVGADYSILGLAPGVIKYRNFNNVLVHEGSGGDTFTVAAAEVRHNLTINGNGGNDVYAWNAANNWSAFFGSYIAVLDGGAGYNILNVNDVSREGGRYDMTDTKLRVQQGVAGLYSGSDFSYDNMQAIGITCGNLDNAFHLSGTSSDIDPGNQVTILLNGGNDDLYVHPRDAAGNLTINGNIGVSGGDGIDALRIDETASALPINYVMANPHGAGTQTLFGMGARGLGTATIENYYIFGGSGADTFGVNEAKSGVALTFRGGLGDDTMNFGNNGLSGITNLASFSFDGEAGSDTFNLNNQTHTGTWIYTRNLGSILASSTLGASFTLTDSNPEMMRINGGPSGETFNINTVAAGSAIEANGAGGADLMQVSPSSSTAILIQGSLSYNAGADGGRAIVYDGADTAGEIFHLDQVSLGAYLGDNLFGTGGSFRFAGLADLNVGAPALTIHLGTGPDTAYVQPLTAGQVLINGNLPPIAPISDRLRLATAALTSPSVNGTAASGNLTSTNRPTLSWTGFEGTIATDAVAPAVVAADINLNGIPGFGEGGGVTQAVVVQFSENVSGLLSAGSLQLTNLTAGQVVPTANLAVQYESATNAARFTFPGYTNGVLPDGNYQGKILAGLPDFFGNGLPADANFSFFFLNGDANHDRSVDIGDFSILASRFNLPGTFSQGDFDYNGITDIGDFAIVASKFNTSLPAARAAISSENGTHSSAVQAADSRTFFAVIRIGESMLQDVDLP